MERMTRKKGEDGIYMVDESVVEHTADGYAGEAINRLAKFENMYEDLVASRKQIPGELEKLRSQGKEKSVTFKELMVKKMMNANIIDLFKMYGLD